MKRFAATLGLLAMASSALANTPPTPEELQAWASQLDDPSFRKREQAMKELHRAGAEAAPILAKTARSGTAEASERALRLLGSMAEGADPRAESAARRQLRRLVESESSVAAEALAILHRRRHRCLDALSAAGATLELDRDKLLVLRMDSVENLELNLPLLQEFPELEDLSLSTRKFTNELAPHLAKLPNLEFLNLYQSNIGNDGLKHLVGLKYLRHLPMGETSVTDDGLRTIAGMTQLDYLGLRGNNVTDVGLAHLKDLTNLRGLNLGQTKITDRGLKHIVGMTRLRSLYLHTTGVTDEGLELLKDLKDLQTLYLAHTRTTPAGHARLREALPSLTINTKFPAE